MKINYKNILKSFLILTVITAVGTGCKKFLETPPIESLPKDVAIADETGLKSVMNSAYQIVGGGNMFGGKIQAINEMLADQLNGSLLNGDFGEIYGRKTSVFGEYKNAMYTDMYQAIFRANTVLENLDKASSMKDNLEGQAKFVRALTHFQLVQLFAQPYGFSTDNTHLGVPIRTSTTINPGVRATVKQVYDQIIADLKVAEVKLPDDNGGYATKWAAKALLAKVYFQMNDFTNAYVYSNQVIASNKFSLDTYASRFAITGTKESIFRIIYTNGGYEPGGELKGQFRSDFNAPTLRFTTDFYASVNTPNDVRKSLYETTKYPGVIATKKYNSDHIEVPVLYLTDMKLIRAESAAETGTNLPTGAQDINDILNRAYAGTKSIPLASSASLIKTNARFERSIEFAGEGNRISEIKRIGAKGENIDKRGAVWNCPGLVLQFPQGEMASNTSFQRNVEGGCN
ncbi:RagB/SusD family nutrient uptake outer membrane protein [Pedobacter boryungensis]|uniref:RagB/SusD family nutrient uptake outer membrane protein n=1 Tax=Pedobacter boryungensis TaxID=869962 RepID=A0ABX2D858_9SPHI|nr:RagB/SusD family nutrient uptake outer membrane protein [Pedobacter boryungensis]NQX30243.1 RagB/SusD family nutrient uptake outer membrane protein [Pedobacter boryungensis]